MKFRFMCLPLVVFLAISTIFFTADVSAAELVSEETETSGEPVQVAYDTYFVFYTDPYYVALSVDDMTYFSDDDQYIQFDSRNYVDSKPTHISFQPCTNYLIYHSTSLNDVVDALVNGKLTAWTEHYEGHGDTMDSEYYTFSPDYKPNEILLYCSGVDNFCFYLDDARKLYPISFQQAPLTAVSRVATVGGMKSVEVVTATLQGIKIILPFLLLFVIGCLAFWKAWTFLQRILQKA